MGYTTTETQIFDYTHSKLVAINTGTANIQTGNFRIIHVIEIDKYDELLRQIESHISEHINRNHILFPFLSQKINSIKNNIHRLQIKNRHPRSINSIGSAWKWIAGNPDHDDFLLLNDKINKVLQNTNDQVIINKLTKEKIKEITNVTNNILKIVKDRGEIDEDLFLNYKYKLDLIEEETKNIEYAINWAKANIANTHILGHEEIIEIEKIIERTDIPFINVDEALEFSKVKIASNNNSILYMMYFPLVNKNKCKTFMIKPVKKQNLAIKAPYENILNCNDNIYGLKAKCKNTNNLSICSNDNIIDLSNTSCIPKLLRSQKADCTSINNQHIPSVEQLSPGLIFLNQYKGPVLIDNETVTLEGTFIIKLHNSTLSIDGRSYTYHEVTTFHPIPALLQPTKQEKQMEEVLSLEMINELQFNNTQIVDQLNRSAKIASIMNLSLGSIVLTILAYGLCKILIKNKDKINISRKIQNEEFKQIENQKKVSDTVNQAIYNEPNQTRTFGLEGGGVNSTNY